jgi:hypothetical protein
LFQPSIQSFRERSVFVAGLFNCTTATPILAFELFTQANAGLAAFLPTVEFRIAFVPFDLISDVSLANAHHVQLVTAGNGARAGSFHSAPSRSIAHSFTSNLLATATMAIFFRLSLPRRTCS